MLERVERDGRRLTMVCRELDGTIRALVFEAAFVDSLDDHACQMLGQIIHSIAETGEFAAGEDEHGMCVLESFVFAACRVAETRIAGEAPSVPDTDPAAAYDLLDLVIRKSPVKGQG